MRNRRWPGLSRSSATWRATPIAWPSPIGVCSPAGRPGDVPLERLPAGNRQRTMTLDAVEFLRRLLLHVLPRGFKRMRHYGLFANGRRKVTLPRCREILGQAPVAPAETRPAVDASASAAPPRPRTDGCPLCGVGQMQVQDMWFAQRTRSRARARLGHLVKGRGNALRAPALRRRAMSEGRGASSSRRTRTARGNVPGHRRTPHVLGGASTASRRVLRGVFPHDLAPRIP